MRYGNLIFNLSVVRLSIIRDENQSRSSVLLQSKMLNNCLRLINLKRIFQQEFEEMISIIHEQDVKLFQSIVRDQYQSVHLIDCRENTIEQWEFSSR